MSQDAVDLFWQVYNETTVELLDDILAPTYVGHVNGRDIPGAAAAKTFISAFKSAFPDARFTIQDRIEAGDKVVTRWTATGTHGGPFLGAEPSNRRINTQGITIFQLAGGKILELWGNWDVFGVMDQIGAD
ncbi:MAG TPA: ester cyclase [Anaerolineae bacterium]